MIISGSAQRRNGAILSYVNVIFKILSGLVYTPIMLRFLGNNEYGIYSLCISFMGYLTLLNAGINAAYVRFYVQTKVKNANRLSGLNGIFLKIFLSISIVALFLGIFISTNSNFIFGNKITNEEYQLIKKLLLIITFNSVITIFNCVFDSIIIANEKFIFGKVISLLNTIMVPIFAIPMLLKGGNSISVAGITLIVNTFTLLFNCIYCFRCLKVRFKLKYKNRKMFNGIVVFSGFIVIQSVMDQLNWQIDKFLLARFSGSVEISVYTVGSQINNIYITIASAITIVFIAQINQLTVDNKKNELSELFVRVARILCMIVMYIMIAYLSFGKEFIKIWAGAEYENAFYVGMLLMLPVTVSLTQGLGQDIMRAQNKHKMQIVINIIVCLLNLFISIPLCKRFGAVGGAAGTCIGLVIICIIVRYIYFEKVGHLDMKKYLKEMFRIAPAFIPSILLGLWINRMKLVSGIQGIVVYGSLYTIIYVTSIWFFGMNHYEKELILSFTKRLRKK